MNSLTSALRFLLKEMIPVILGILIALYVNKYVEDQNQEEYIHRVMTSIEGEFEENMQELEEMIDEHTAFIDTVDHHLQNDTMSIGELLLKTNGIRLVSIKNATAQTLLNSNIHLTDFEQFSPLVDIQEAKTHLLQIQRELMRSIYSGLDSSEKSQKMVLRSILNDIVYTEEALLEAHQQFLESE